jgi:hypothetical protein
MANDRLPDPSNPAADAPGPDASGPLPRDATRAEIEAAARHAAASPDFPAAYIERVREQSARFALRTADPGDIRAAIALLEEQTNLQALAPIESSNRGVVAAKKVVRKAVFFAINHVTEQMRALGWATTSVGIAAAERIEALEARVKHLESGQAGVEARLRRLEDPSES